VVSRGIHSSSARCDIRYGIDPAVTALSLVRAVGAGQPVVRVSDRALRSGAQRCGKPGAGGSLGAQRPGKPGSDRASSHGDGQRARHGVADKAALAKTPLISSNDLHD
jgi:hypothetical protein